MAVIYLMCMKKKLKLQKQCDYNEKSHMNMNANDVDGCWCGVRDGWNVCVCVNRGKATKSFGK